MSSHCSNKSQAKRHCKRLGNCYYITTQQAEPSVWISVLRKCLLSLIWGLGQDGTNSWGCCLHNRASLEDSRLSGGHTTQLGRGEHPSQLGSVSYLWQVQAICFQLWKNLKQYASENMSKKEKPRRVHPNSHQTDHSECSPPAESGCPFLRGLTCRSAVWLLQGEYWISRTGSKTLEALSPSVSQPQYLTQAFHSHSHVQLG